jgi:putative endonuclease
MSEPLFSLYILRCADGSLYTGIAADVEKRLAEHQSGPRGAKYLRGRQPLKLEFSQAIGDRALASRLEYRVKRLSRARKESLIAGTESLHDLTEDQVSEDVSA